mgnify:FL=1
MTNVNQSTISQESTMTKEDLIKQLFDLHLESGGDPKVTQFKSMIDGLIKTEVKPLCGGSRRTMSNDGSVATTWRDELKLRFSGRGAKWVQVSIDEVMPTLALFDDEGVDTTSYREWVTVAGYAWIRFSGPRLHDGVESAAFEVRTTGSTNDQPRQLHYIDVERLDDVVTPLGGTPHSMKLELKPTTEKLLEAHAAKVAEVDVTEEPEVTEPVVVEDNNDVDDEFEESYDVMDLVDYDDEINDDMF